MNDTPQIDRTSLAYWFPKIEAAGVPVPKTRLVAMPAPAIECMWKAFDGVDGTDEQTASMKSFSADLTAAAAEVGWPCFLRTDHTSAKHEWDRSCYLTKPEDVPRHVFSIIEYSEMVDIMGLPWQNWAVREFLPTIPFGTCPGYGGMPICKEFRFFVDDGKVRCMHPYWPKAALERGGVKDTGFYDALCRMDDEASLRALAEKAGAAVGGSWSIDLLETSKGWFVTDMAEASKSFHWEGCPRAFDKRS